MSGIWAGIVSLLYSIFIDVIVFALVDIVAKTLLKEIGSSQRERRLLWLAEFLVLVLLSVFVYVCDHTPWVLIFFALLTFVTTQLPGHLDVVRWWSRVKTHWDEHHYMQQHVESIQQMQENLARHQQGQATLHPLPQPVPLYQPNPTRGLGPPPPYPSLAVGPPAFAQEKAGPPGAGQGTILRNDNHWALSRPVSMSSLPAQPLVNLTQLPQQQQPQPVHLRQRNLRLDSITASRVGGGNAPKKQTSDLAPNTNLNHWYGGNELRRRPLHSTLDAKPGPEPATGIATKMSASVVNATASLKSSLMSAMGLGGPMHLPAGFKNTGQNVCFINASFQCLARTPHLVSSLSQLSRPEWKQAGLAKCVMFSTAVELLSACQESATEAQSVILDTTAFRQAASGVEGTLVAHPEEPQTQQDAAEFLMWMLDKLHSVLNTAGTATAGSDGERFSSPALKMMKFIYGDLNPSKIQDLKDACRREINMANGLDNNSYAEAIQRLSDLEWLAHKQANNSIIEDLFTGQLVEAYHCLSDNHISVNLQAFSVLPVPITAPRDGSNVVYLEDCFTAFCHIEHLIGHESPECSWCAAGGGKGEDGRSAAAVNRRVTRSAMQVAATPPMPTNATRLSSDSAFMSPGSSSSFVSPILAGPRDFVNESGFHDNNYKTSTPIRSRNLSLAQMAEQPTTRLRDVQRRVLLRQLPECLAIHLLRFSYNSRAGRSKKVKAPVRICVRDLDLTNVIYDNVTLREDLTATHPSYLYDLFGFCVHLGADSTSYGHYIAYVQASKNRWYRCDDEIVTEVNIEQELATREVLENAYLLFYKRVHR